MADHAILWLVRWPVGIRARAHAVGRRNKQFFFFSPGLCEARIFRELFLRLWREVNQMAVHPHTERCSEQGCRSSAVFIPQPLSCLTRYLSLWSTSQAIVNFIGFSSLSGHETHLGPSHGTILYIDRSETVSPPVIQ